MLMESRTPNGSAPSSYVIRELNETARCDSFLGGRLRTVRDAYGSYLEKHGEAGIKQRVEALKTTEHDEKISLAAVLHYNTWTQQQLRKALPLTVRLHPVLV